MAGLWRRVPVAADWIVAVIGAVVIYNLNITSAGGPLSGVGLSEGPTTAGITEMGRTTFYGALMVGGAVLAAAGLIVAGVNRRRSEPGAMLSRTFAGLALAGTAGLLLDYRDGPVSWVHLVVYAVVVLAVVRFVRVSLMLTTATEQELATSNA